MRELMNAFRDRSDFFFPGTGKTFEDWTDAVRRREVDILEAEAIAEIENALVAR